MLPVAVARVRTGLDEPERNACGRRGVSGSRRPDERVHVGAGVVPQYLARVVGVGPARIGRVLPERRRAHSAAVAEVVQRACDAQLAEAVAALHVAEPEVFRRERLVSRHLVREVVGRERVARDAFEREERGERVRPARISEALESERDGAVVRIR